MRQTVTVVTALSLIALLLMVTVSAAAHGDPHGPRAAIGGADDSTVIVTYVKGTDKAAKLAAESAVTGHRIHSLKTGAHVLDVGHGKSQDAIAKLRKDPHVRSVEPNYRIAVTTSPTDSLYRYQWPARNAANPGHDISAEDAWAVTTGSSSIIVGVLDSGIDYTHPDLAANVWSNPGGIGGCAAGTHGYNFVYGTCDPMDDESVSHGTAVSGVIGAVGNNGIGVSGVNQTTRLIGLKIANSGGTGSVANGIAAIDWAIRAKQAGVNIRVLNNSWGYSGPPIQALQDEIDLAGANGILFVAAAGNGSVDLGTSPFYPCAYRASNTICVGASDSQDNLASFSNYGPRVDLTAPGTNIISTKIWSETAGGGGGYPQQGYSYWGGTSLATPFVSGAAALVLSVDNLSPATLKTRILDSVDAVPSLAGLVKTGGRLNVGRAVAGGHPPPPPTPTSTPGPTPTPPSTSAPGPTPTPTATPDPAPTRDPTPTATVTPPQAPTKPGSPTLSVGAALQSAESGIHLSWTAPADNGSQITGYKVYRGTRSGKETLLTAVGPDSGYEDTSAIPGTKYFYKTSALNAVGESAKSNEVSAVLPAPPTAPRSLKVAVVSTGGLKLTWSPPSKAGTSPIIGYWIWRGDATGGEVQLAQVGTVKSYVDLSTTVGVKVWYVVTAINAVGESPPSNEVGATPTK